MTHTQEVDVYEVIERTQSRLRAQTAIERIAVAGKFIADRFNSAGIVFKKVDGNRTTTLSIRRSGPKHFEAVQEEFASTNSSEDYLPGEHTE